MINYQRLHLLATTIVLLGSIEILIKGLLHIDIIEKLFHPWGQTSVRLLIGIMGLYLIMDKEVWFPDLAPSLLPCNLLHDKEQTNANLIYPIKISPHSKIIYWSDLPWVNTSGDFFNFKKKDFSHNNGITTSDHQGNAWLKIRYPDQYHDTDIIHPRYIYYRICHSPMQLSEVRKIYLDPIILSSHRRRSRS